MGLLGYTKTLTYLIATNICLFSCVSTEIVPAPRPAPNLATSNMAPIDQSSFTGARPSMVQPVYPTQAARSGQEGWVLLTYDVDLKGKVFNVKVLDASPANFGFEQSAVEAVRKSTYPPFLVEGKTQIQKGLKIVMQFQLSK